MSARIPPFPLPDREARVRLDALTTARQVLRNCAAHDDDAIRSAINVASGWGTTADSRLVDEAILTLQERGHARIRAARQITDEATAEQAALIRRSRCLARIQIAAALALCILLANIATKAPATIAATVLQAQEVQTW